MSYTGPRTSYERLERVSAPSMEAALSANPWANVAFPARQGEMGVYVLGRTKKTEGKA